MPWSYLQAIMMLHMFCLAVPAMLWGFLTSQDASYAGSGAPLPSSRSPAPNHRLAACHSAPLHAQATLSSSLTPKMTRHLRYIWSTDVIGLILESPHML